MPLSYYIQRLAPPSELLPASSSQRASEPALSSQPVVFSRSVGVCRAPVSRGWPAPLPSPSPRSLPRSCSSSLLPLLPSSPHRLPPPPSRSALFLQPLVPLPSLLLLPSSCCECALHVDACCKYVRAIWFVLFLRGASSASSAILAPDPTHQLM